MLIQSAQTVLAALQRSVRGGDRIPALVLGSVETVAAVLFLVPRTMTLGAIGLMTVFGLGFLVHAARGQLSLPLLVYAAAVYSVMSAGATAGKTDVAA